MPLIIDGGHGVPPRWQEKTAAGPDTVPKGRETTPDCLQIAFINNMPDPALEDTEMQFFELLDAAAGDIPVALKLYALPEVPRSDGGREHINDYYFDVNLLKSARVDGLIITGTEPKRPNLRDEPYWASLVDLFEWAERNTSSTVLSCLAAHASVLHSEGIERHPLADKRFGVLNYVKPRKHPLTNGTPDVVSIPHSRWNEVREGALTECGYSILTKAPEIGVDLFVKEKRNSLFVHFQGHPEYNTHTLMKEFRRDVRRFLTAERETFPSLPHQYFDAKSTALLNEFRENALSHRREELLDLFPYAEVTRTLQNTWRFSAQCLYSNWLRILASRKADAPKLRIRPPVSGKTTEQSYRIDSAMKRSA